MSDENYYNVTNTTRLRTFAFSLCFFHAVVCDAFDFVGDNTDNVLCRVSSAMVGGGPAITTVNGCGQDLASWPGSSCFRFSPCFGTIVGLKGGFALFDDLGLMSHSWGFRVGGV